MTDHIIPVYGQSFKDEDDWIKNASRELTCHEKYLNTEHEGPDKGWRGEHFTAMCFDQLGRRCRNGSDFMRATSEGAYPIWWIWPDQIFGLVTKTLMREGED